MKKRSIIILALLLTMAFVFAACGAGGDKGKENDDPASSTPETSKEPAKDPVEEEPEEEAGEDYGDTGGLKLPVVDEVTVLSFMVPSDIDGLNEKPIYDHFEKRTNVRLDMQVVPKESFPEKLNIVMGSGSLPDIISNGGLTVGGLNTYGSQGAFASVMDYLDEMPNFKRIFVDDPENNWMTYTYADDGGNVYTLPIYRLNRDVNFGFMYRADAFEKADIKPWTDHEGFYQNLVDLKAAYPESYPFSSKNGEEFFQREATAWGIQPGAIYFDQDLDEWAYTYSSDKFKEMIDFWKKCHDEGLLDPEFMTNTQDSWTAKMTTGTSFVTHDWIGRLDLFTGQMADIEPDFDFRYGYPAGSTGNINSLESFSSWGLSVAKNDKSEIAMKFIDYMYSPSGSELFTTGVEGEMFEWDENHKPVYTDLGDTQIDINVLEETYGMWVEGAYIHPDRNSHYYDYSEREQEAQDIIMKNSLLDPLVQNPKFEDKENGELADLMNTLYQEGVTFAAKYVTDASYGDSQWEDWIKKAEQIGSSRAVKIYNTAQARYTEYMNNK